MFHVYLAPYTFTKCKEGFGWAQFATVRQLRQNGLLVNDKLQFQVDLTIFGPAKSSPITEADKNPARPDEPLDSGTDFSFLLGSQALSDLTVYCGSETFPAHKAILAGRSQVLRTIVTTDLEVIKCGSLVVSDVSAPIFQMILHYLYTGKLKENLETDSLLELTRGADKYGLEELKNYCFRKLAGCVTEETAAALVTAAHDYNAEASVKEALQQFMKPYV